MLGFNPQMTSIRCMLHFGHRPLNTVSPKTTIVFVYEVKWRPNYTYSSIVTFTTQHEQHFITKFMIFWTKPALLNDLNAWVIPICCAYIYMVCLMRRLPFQWLFSTLLTNFWNVAIDSSKVVYSFCVLFMFLFLEFTRAVFWKFDVTRQSCTSQATACSKIVVK